jgi:hypothetical protein
MDGEYRIFWGDTHHNTYQHYVQDPPMTEILAFASTYLDFYTGAYYTPAYVTAPVVESLAGQVTGPQGGHLSEMLPASMEQWTGVHLEGLKDLKAMAREWAEFQEATQAWNRPGEFVALPGYEWQGSGRWGDHNVIHRNEGAPICTADTLPELYAFLRELNASDRPAQGTAAIAIPHHTGYFVGQRAPTWSACDERLSPFVELYSIHGCSETDEEWIGLRHNSHMGPGAGGGTYQEALDAGLHLGAICSTDNWTNMPGYWGQGLMACLAQELTRDSLWEAFLARRVYGVTGDRIELIFTCNGAPMGSVLAYTPQREIRVEVRGSDAIDRIEILRNGQVVATHCHQGTWTMPSPGTKTHFKMRIEAGWGPRLGEVPTTERQWEGMLSLDEGCFVGWQPCWITHGQGVPKLDGDTARFALLSRQENVPRSFQGGTLFEFEAAPDAELHLWLNGMEERDSVRAFAERSRLLWYRADCVNLVCETTGVTPENARRGDVYYQLAHKAKLHRALPESAYTATLSWVDKDPLDGSPIGIGTHYRVRVEQRNGQRAWSSPIWIKAAEA